MTPTFTLTRRTGTLGLMARWMLPVLCGAGPLVGSIASAAETTETAAAAIAQAATSTAATVTWSPSLFDHLDLANPALARVAALVKAGQFGAAREALCEHFRSRRVRSGFWPSDPRSAQNPDDILNHVFSFYGSPKFDAGHPIRWNDTFLNDSELTYALNRHQHLTILASAYGRTHDPRYARGFVEQLRDWIAQHPSTDNVQSWAAWRDLETATRIGVWSDVFLEFIRAPEFAADDQLLMLQSLYEQTKWLAPQVGPRQGDWSVALATGLATVGVLFPEFKESGEWRRQAYASLVGDLQEEVYPDGSQAALSPTHHNATLTSFWLPLKLAIENGVPVPAVYSKTIESMAAYEAYLRRPDGRYPAFNASEPQDCQPILVAAGAFFKRADFAYILSRGQIGAAPTSTSCAFRPSGVFILRDNWSAQGNYLALDAGPYGTSSQHEDKLGLELAAYGRTVLVDPGRYLLDVGQPLAQYLTTTQAHNTLTVDGSGQRRAQFAASWVPSGNSPNTWISRGGFDYFAGSYVEGYENTPDAKHLRRVFFVKGKQRPYWVISDRVVGTGAHQLTSRWQFAPGELERAGQSGLTFATKSAGGNLAICPPAELARSWVAKVPTGSRDPMGGWVSLTYGKVEPAPQLCYDVQTSLPASLEYVLVPFAGEAKAPAVHIPQSASRKPQADVTSLDLDFGEIHDTVFLAHDLKNVEREVGGLRTKGCFVVIRTMKGSQPAVLIDAGFER